MIVIGYGCAVLAAGFFLATLLYSQIDLNVITGDFIFWQDDVADLKDLWSPFGYYNAVLVAAPILAVFCGGFSFFPALLAIIWSEIRAIRGSVYYCICGLLIGLLAVATSNMVVLSGQDTANPLAFILGVQASAGIIGGFVYWLVAGRNAGRLFERPA